MSNFRNFGRFEKSVSYLISNSFWPSANLGPPLFPTQLQIHYLLSSFLFNVSCSPPNRINLHMIFSSNLTLPFLAIKFPTSTHSLCIPSRGFIQFAWVPLFGSSLEIKIYHFVNGAPPCSCSRSLHWIGSGYLHKPPSSLCVLYPLPLSSNNSFNVDSVNKGVNPSGYDW